MTQTPGPDRARCAPERSDRVSPREAAVVAFTVLLLAWYRLRFALPAPVGGHGLLHRRMATCGGTAAEAKRLSRDDDRDPRQRVARLARLFRRALERTPAGVSCVPRSLALLRLLRLHGLGAELRVGMRRAGSGLAGHAWVEHHGAVIAQRPEFVGTFVPLLFHSATRPPRVEEAP